MPYIYQDMRLELDSEIENLADIIKKYDQKDRAGILNYIFSSLLEVLPEKQWNYHTINEAIGVLECAKLEFYRRFAAPYEDKKIKENGDLVAYRKGA
jgi:hypothetical protein